MLIGAMGQTDSLPIFAVITAVGLCFLAIVEQKHREQQQQTRPHQPLTGFPPPAFLHAPSWNFGLGSCFGAIHRLSWSDLWMIKFMHCQSPFLPDTNTSGIEPKRRSKNSLRAAGHVTTTEACEPWRVQVLRLELVKKINSMRDATKLTVKMLPNINPDHD